MCGKGSPAMVTSKSSICVKWIAPALQAYAPAQRSPLGACHRALSTGQYAVARCAPAWGGSALDVAGTKAQRESSLAERDHVPTARRQRASLPRTDSDGYSNHEGV